MKFFLKNQGVITAFVTMIMVPVVVFTGIFVDMSRFKFCSSQAIMASDAYAEGILGTYDNVLKELYGLFSITQSDEGKKAIEEIANYIGCSFDPSKEDTNKTDMGHNFSVGNVELEGSMPYSAVDVELEYQPIKGATLTNSDVFLTQVGDFMKYRIIADLVDKILADQLTILDAFEGIEKIGSDSEAMDTVNKIGENSAKALGKIQEYYENLKKIEQYRTYKENLEAKYVAYSNAMKSVVTSDDYKKYIYYKNPANKQRIDDAKAYVESYNARKEAAESRGEVFTEEIDQSLVDEADKYVDIGEYQNRIRGDVGTAKSAANNYKSNPIDFDNAETFIKNLNKLSDDIEGSIKSIENNLEELYGTSDMENLEISGGGQLSDCSEKVQKGIDLDIKGDGSERDPSLQKIAELRGYFDSTYEVIEVTNKNINRNNVNKENYTVAVEDLDDYFEKIINGEIAPDTVSWRTEIASDLSWFDFMLDSETKEFYLRLKEICEPPVDSANKNKNAAQQKIDDANDRKAKDEAIINGDENEIKKKNIRNIGDDLAKELKGGGDGEEPKLGIIGISSFKGLPDMIIDKFLLASYNFGMFSSRVTGIEVKEDDETEIGGSDTEDLGEAVENITEEAGKEDSEKEFADYSLTNYKMSRDINYLYGAELEYLFGGNKNSIKNLNAVRNTICGVRMGLNYASTYSIDAINGAIKAAATAAASAVAATGVGASAIPLIRMSVSAALRAAVATAETAQEWAKFVNREKVLLYKNKLDDLEIKNDLENIIGKSVSEGDTVEDALELKLSYEDYLYLLMMIFINTDTLTSRTSDLITLNVNHSQNNKDTLTTLDFKMEDTVTAIESTCKVKMDFVVVPDNFANMFISGTDTETTIKSMEDNYTGFTLIRGY